MAGDTMSWSTTASLAGDTLTIVISYVFSGATVSGTGTEIYVFERYTGVFPPQSWPTVNCGTLQKRLDGSLQGPRPTSW
jgi:hypothetical protein